MTVVKNISQLPDTKQGFEQNINNLTMIGGILICEPDFTIPIADINDVDSWYTEMLANQFTPLHNVKEFEPLDKETGLNESLQDFTYETYKGQYRNKSKFDWSIDYHKLVNELNGTNKYVIYYDLNWNIYATSDDGVNLRGFKTNRLILEKLLFSIGTTPAFSVLDIELYDSDELNVNGVVQKVDWNPEDLDRRFINIKVEYIDQNTLNFSVTHNGENIDDISSSDVTVTDERNGVLTFSLFSYLGGVYQLSGFSDNLISGKLEVLATLYIGCVAYSYKVVVEVSNNFVFEDNENFVFEDGENFIYEIQI
jgi:hypothetical protein